MKELYKIAPVFEARMWGGQVIRERFDYDTDLPNIAEVYNVVAIPGHLDNDVMGTEEKLSAFYRNHRELFGCRTEEMPVMTCIAHAHQPLSIQIHPDDEYGMKHDGMRGRPEGFVIIDGLEDNEMVMGHHAKTLEEFKRLALNKDWDKLLRNIHMKQGEYIHIPVGTLHAFGIDSTAVAFSVNGDITYRLYDYDRIDPLTNQPRPIHIQQVFDNIKIPDDEILPIKPVPYEKDGCEITLYYDEPGCYTSGRVRVGEKGVYKQKEFLFFTCLEGAGKIGGMDIKAGETIFVPCDFGKVDLEGKLDLVYVSYKDKI